MFYKKSKLDPRIAMTRNEFVEVFPQVKDMGLFTFVPDLVGGFKPKFLNINQKPALYGYANAGLTEIQMEIQTEKASHMGLTPDEMETVRAFFDEEIRGQDASQVLRVYQRLLSNISNKELYTIIIDRITKSKGNDFEFFHVLVSQIVKNTTTE